MHVLVDYHVHTPYCGHAQRPIVEYVEEALRLGFSEIAFTDHLCRYYLSDSQRKRLHDWGMDERNLRRYYAELSELKEVYAGRIVIRTGLEVDFIEGAEEKLLPLIDAFPFDVLLGSLHCLPKFGWRHISETGSASSEQIFEEYFAQAEVLLRSGLFQSLAHLDFVWRYVKWPHSKVSGIFDRISEVVRTAASCDVALEVNANAYLWSQLYQVKGGDPFSHFLEQIHAHRAPITLGSDAHHPRHVGKSFPQLIEVLKDKGITAVSVFEAKKRRLVELG